jgi:predicted nucleic acid-binding protein
MPSTKKIYWDSCIFLAWLKNEPRSKEEVDGIAECVDLVEAKQVHLITSVITITEVFEGNLSADANEKYRLLLSRRNVTPLDNDLRVSRLAQKIREYYQNQKTIDGLDGLSTPDAIHLATAIHYDADVFYTFDEGKKNGRKGRSLLSISGDVAGYNLKISKPTAMQFRLFG